jgi:hypothetical protein
MDNVILLGTFVSGVLDSESWRDAYEASLPAGEETTRPGDIKLDESTSDRSRGPERQNLVCTTWLL